jgi:hypothetical protein
MGGFVVTNAIRVLSDLFADVYSRRRLNAGVVNEATEGAVLPAPPQIGNVFKLMRFVLASPDIPAETLLSNRANFLASSLRRSREAYLFSSEGDEVLRQISTLANYFIFPTKIWKYGFRLGNVEILSSGYGVVPVERENFLQTLRIGYYTLAQLYETLLTSREEHPVQQAARAGGPEQHSRSLQDLLPQVFTYFDCTDYVDTPVAGGGPTALLTFALRRKSCDPAARMRWWQHVHLLWSYVVAQKPNVHGGYFEGELCAQLMYRLACIGFDDTLLAYGGGDLLSEQCERKQIRVLWSPQLLRKASLDPDPRPKAQEDSIPVPAPAPAIGVRVPDVVGLDIAKARETIESVRLWVGNSGVAGRPGHLLAIREIEERSSDTPGTVIRQTPKGGEFVPQGRSAELVVATP